MTHRFTLPVSAAAALAAHRDGLPAFAPDLPGLSHVTPVSRTRDGTAEVLKHHWQGDLAVLPRLVRRLVRPEQVAWRDVGRWDPVEGTGTWEIHIPVLGAGPHISGTHRFCDSDEGCSVVVTATLTFVARADMRLVGVPIGRLMAPRIQRAVQDVFAAIVTHSGDIVLSWLRTQDRRAA